MSTTTTRTITLTEKRPVKIIDAEWPIIAQGDVSGDDFDPGCPNPATEKWSDWIKVRQHADGRAIVYGGSDYERDYGTGDYRYRAGVLIQPGESIEAAIGSVSGTLAGLRPTNGRVAAHAMRDAALECVASLPAVEI